MLCCVLLALMALAMDVECYGSYDTSERLAHGRQLKIYLPKNAERLEFTSVSNPGNTLLYWDKHHRVPRGTVSGTGNDRRWYIDKVTYADEGTYTQKDFWNKEISNVKVAVIPRYVSVSRIPGESLYVSLEGIDMMDASMYFSGESANITLVEMGSAVSQGLPQYWGRVTPHRNNIEVKDVNVSDVGHYTIKDRRDRVVSVTRLDLTDHHDSQNPLLALLLLLGIPAGVCCCCRKKICKQKASTTTTTTTIQATPEVHQPTPGGPAGHPPSYHPPPGEPTVFYHGPNMGPTVQPPPGGQWNGPPPSPGFNPAYPPQNAGYPPQNQGYPPQNPGYPPQNLAYPPGDPAGQPGPYPPVATAMGYAPVMYSAPPPEGAVVPPAESSSAVPLLPPQVDSAATPTPPSDTAYQFQINKGKDSSSFL